MAPGKFDADAVIEQVGLRIAELREAKGLTQVEMSRLVGVELRNAQRYESGVNLTLTTLVKIANALDVAPAELLEPPRRTRKQPGRPPGKSRS